MPVLQGQVSVPAASVNDNILTGSQFEFVPYDAQIDFYLNGDTGASDLRVDVYSGNDILMEGGMVSNANRIPVRPDDKILTDVAAAGERLKVRVRNLNSSTARTVFYAVEITPI